MNNLNNFIYETLKDQKDIFGDDLFEKINISIPDIKKDVHKKIETINEPLISAGKFVEDNLILEDWQKSKTLNELDSKINTCQKCSLGKTRTNFVFGVGNPNADVMIIGEAPGADEDAKGEPFVGRAGKLLNDILKAINFEREEVFIANILKCRPPNNRNPLPDEMATCIPYLKKQIDLIQPKLILCLGLVASSGILNLKLSLTKMRGNIYEFNGVKTMVTYHPAALLRNPNWKKGCWEDVQKFRKLYDELKSN